MNLYELVFILKEDKEENINQITKLLESFEIKIQNKEGFGKRDLVYPIKKNTKGTYFIWKISSNPAFIKELKSKLNLEENVIRYLLLKI